MSRWFFGGLKILVLYSREVGIQRQLKVTAIQFLQGRLYQYHSSNSCFLFSECKEKFSALYRRLIFVWPEQLSNQGSEKGKKVSSQIASAYTSSLMLLLVTEKRSYWGKKWSKISPVLHPVGLQFTFEDMILLSWHFGQPGKISSSLLKYPALR